MRESGKLSGAIEVLAEFEARPQPLKACLQEWGRAHRFAGSKDRAWISDLCHDVVRSRQSLAFRMQDDSPRALCLAALRHLWYFDVARLAEVAAEEPFGPGALTANEQHRLEEPLTPDEAPLHVAGDYPEWLSATLFAKSFDTVTEGQALAERAPVDLRVNPLKSDPEKTLKAFSRIGAVPGKLSTLAIRIPALGKNERRPSIDAMPAFAKGWVEVQDLGSQLASLSAGDIKGRQVLDYCAGAGGKTLALAAMAENSGQIFAWDIDAKRLAPIFERLRRAGTRNVQVRSPADGGTLEDLAGKMDVVFIDAPCSGSGTWRRKPDSKWRLTETQLHLRMAQQDSVLREAARYVRPGGRLIYVTCSILPEENSERVRSVLEENTDFEQTDPVLQMAETGLLLPGAAEHLRSFILPEGGLQLTPARTDTDGFFVATMIKKG